MKYLVTGGAGFIGSHLCAALVARGDSVVVLDDLSTGIREKLPAGVTFIKGDICDLRKVEEAMSGVDGVFHLAAVASVARSHTHWLRTHQVNLTGTLHVFISAAERKIPVVYASSAAVYGDAPESPLHEDLRCTPINAYGADKLACELHARIAARNHGLKVAGLRFFNIYGPGQNPDSDYSGVISIFTRMLKAGETLSIFGDGEQGRDFIYIGDAVSAQLLAMEKLHAGAFADAVFNICTGGSTSINQLAVHMAKALNVALKKEHKDARAGDIRFSLGAPELAKTVLGFTATTRLEDGLKHTLAA